MERQILANFIVEFIEFPIKVRNAPARNPWQVFINGSFYRSGEGAKVHITTNSREEHHYAIKLAFKTTNNETEYKTLLTELSGVEALRVAGIEVKANSQVVVNQVLG